jgi:hypothetical protein
MGHGYRALVAEFIDDPDTWGGRVHRRYGRAMMRRLAELCVECHFADKDRARIARMHTAYRRRGAKR